MDNLFLYNYIKVNDEENSQAEIDERRSFIEKKEQRWLCYRKRE
jgi:hypothetical protein